MATNGNDLSHTGEKTSLPPQHGSHDHYETAQPAGNLNQNNYTAGRALAPIQSYEGYPAHHGILQPHAHRKFANPAPLGLSAFALTTFVLSCVNMHARGVEQPTIAVTVAYGYGGLVQLLAGMWEMAVGNTFGATALSSYGGFWISYAIILTPTWGILEPEGPYNGDVGSVLGFFLTGWFIFTTLLLLCTMRSSLAFFILFFTLDIAFLCLMCEQYALDMGNEVAKDNLQQAGGLFGFLAAFAAWYNALAGIADKGSNSFFELPLGHFPWSEKKRAARNAKAPNHVA